MADCTSLFFRPLDSNPPAVTRGCISLLSTSISALSESVLSAHENITRNTQPAHITLLSKDEYREYTANPKKTNFDDIDLSKIYSVGISNKKDTWFIPVIWSAGNFWRTKNGFSVKDFHITLSESDLHDIDKSIYTIRKPDAETNLTEINGIYLPANLDIDLLDHLCLSSNIRDDPLPRQLQWAEHLITTHPSSERGYLRLADLAYKQSWYKLAMLSYYRAFILSSPDFEKRRTYYTKRIVSCGDYTEFGPLFTESELTQLTMTTSPSIHTSLTAPWDPTLPLPLPTQPLSRPTFPRARLFLPPSQKLPRFFSWLIPLHLAAMSTPRTNTDIPLLHTLGITHIITLTSETPLSRTWFPPCSPIRNTFIPTANYHPPTTLQTDRILHLILSEPYHSPSTPGRTLIHCGGGKGRAGTILAIYLALFAFTPPHLVDPSSPPQLAAGTALNLLRRLRPGSVETEQQERFITAYVSTAWKRHGRGEPLIGTGGEVEEPGGASLEVSGDVEAPDLVLLVGVQGAGKSAFARLCKVRNPAVVVVSPDEVVAEGGAGRAACEGVVGRFRVEQRGVQKEKRRVCVLDRCNPTRKERVEWRRLFTPGAKVVAVWFDYDSAVCIARGENRGEHPTMTPWRMKGAVGGMAGVMEAPTLEEGLSGVVRVRGFDNAVELADLWFGSVSMLKFPRTRHLLDLGGATRDDLVVSAQDLALRWFGRTVVVEEKVDGANLGFSLDASGKIRVQNRSHYITPADQAQFAKLGVWMERHGDALRRVLRRDTVVSERFVLYGEWVAATHSIAYERLPDWFLAFDLYDRLSGAWAGRDTLVGVLEGSGVCVVPELWRGVLEGEEMLRGFLERGSAYGGGRVEGVVVRWEGGERGKVVRGDFIAGTAHWSKNVYRKNGLAREVQEEGQEEENMGVEVEGGGEGVEV